MENSIRKKVLVDAQKIVCTDRNKQYGEPENNFEAIKDAWNVYLKHRGIIKEKQLESWDIPMMMDFFKQMRVATAESPSYDSFVDVCGYAACAAELVFRDVDNLTVEKEGEQTDD